MIFADGIFLILHASLAFQEKLFLSHWKVRMFIRFVLIVSIFWPDKRFSRYLISFWRRLADMMKKILLPTDLPTSTSHCQPSSFQVNKKMSRETRLKRLDKIQEIWYNKKEHSSKWVTVSPARSFFTCLNVLFVLVAGARFELTTFGLWGIYFIFLIHFKHT